jgi:hypothetical protein
MLYLCAGIRKVTLWVGDSGERLCSGGGFRRVAVQFCACVCREKVRHSREATSVFGVCAYCASLFKK